MKGRRECTEHLPVTLRGKTEDTEDAGFDLGDLEVRFRLGEEGERAEEAVAVEGREGKG
jgi:hypothetical protein